MAVVEGVLSALGLDPTGAVGSAVGLALLAIAITFVWSKIVGK